MARAMNRDFGAEAKAMFQSEVDAARDAIEKLSKMTEAGDKEKPDLTQICVPFMLPTTPDFVVEELRDASFIPSKGKPLKFTVVDKNGNTKTYEILFQFFLE